MVKTTRIAIIAASVFFQIIHLVSAKEIAEYRIGDSVAEDIITPVPLMVVDPVATRELKEREAQRIPVIFRYNQSVAAEVDAEIRETFSQAHDNFMKLVQNKFRRPRLEGRQLKTEQFDNFIAAFKRQHRSFPLTRALAEDWALGSDGLAAQINLLARVRQIMEQPIRYHDPTNTPKIGNHITLVTTTDNQKAITLEDVKTRGRRESKTNLFTLERARQALAEKFDSGEQEAATFATRRLRVNAFVESALTLAARARQTEALFVADHFQAGQAIAKRGQLVDQKIMAAFTQMQEKTLAGKLQQQVEHEKTLADKLQQQVEQEKTLTGKLQQQVAQEKIQSARTQADNRWLVIGLSGAGILLVGLLAWLAFRRKPGISLMPALASAKSLTDSEQASDGWQQRALAAEEKVARAQDAIRSGVMAQLKEKTVSSLVAQRSEMLEAQQAAAAEMAELERRLNELKTPLQERLRAYESRIADLERALAVKGDENRELIRAKIELTRKQLEAERKRSSLQFN